MRKLLVFSAFFAIVFCDAYAAPAQRRGTAAATATAAAPSAGVTSARAATNARTAPRAAAPAAVAARAGTTTAVRGAAKTAPVATSGAKTPAVSARAATTQKVIGTGTKVATAAKNTVVNEECQQKYNGCMDAFCMLDNATGGRCLCSNRNAELNDILAQIEKLDQQSYQMATVGVERIEMGADADAAMAAAAAAAQSVLNKDANVAQQGKKTARKALDLSLWDTAVDLDEEENIFGNSSTSDGIENKEGDALHSAAIALCTAQIPECAADIKMLQMLYAQQIRSDCTAYENSLKQQKTASAQKLAAAEQALREAALEQLHTANKYDLGQCTIEFKKCMASTGGCKEDFTGCVGLAAAENATRTSGVRGATAAQHVIKGTTSQITIAASTYDTLLSKKPLCESVTKSCVAVADQVWDTFLREIAPTMKSAELIAESNLRTSCISNISECFQKACKDTMDPNDPDGSYDMCLSRPETIESLCKVQIDPCKAAEPMIMDFVKARLASIRVDSCTTEVKECLQSSDRCGSDYMQCVGLDTDSIIQMCPDEKLTACVTKYSDGRETESLDEYLSRVVQGIMLNIDNNMLEYCQNAANEAMIKVCGDTESCNDVALSTGVGSRSLEYKVCEYSPVNGALNINYNKCVMDASQVSDSDLGRGENSTIKQYAGVIDGVIQWQNIGIDEKGNIALSDDYEKKMTGVVGEDRKQSVLSEINTLQNNVNSLIAAIESDPKVQFCMTGREVQGMRVSRTNADGETVSEERKVSRNGQVARFPNLTEQMRYIISNAALNKAQKNYYKKYDELSEIKSKDFVKLSERAAAIAGQNALDFRREAARQSCVSFAAASALPTNSKNKNNQDFAATESQNVGSKSMDSVSYKETVTSTFSDETLMCHRCTRSQTCKKPKKKYCKEWNEEVEKCVDIQF